MAAALRSPAASARADAATSSSKARSPSIAACTAPAGDAHRADRLTLGRGQRGSRRRRSSEPRPGSRVRRGGVRALGPGRAASAPGARRAGRAERRAQVVEHGVDGGLPRRGVVEGGFQRARPAPRPTPGADRRWSRPRRWPRAARGRRRARSRASASGCRSRRVGAPAGSCRRGDRPRRGAAPRRRRRPPRSRRRGRRRRRRRPSRRNRRRSSSSSSVVAPVDHGAQRPVPTGRAAGRAQQPQVVVEAGEQAVDAERPAAGRGQLDGEGHAVEAPADLGHQRRVGVAGPAGARRTVEEELLGLAGSPSSARAVSPSAGIGSTRSPATPRRSRLVARTTAVGARGEEPTTNAATAPSTCSQLSSTRRRAADAQPFVHEPLEGLLGALDHAEGGGHGLDDELGAHRHQVDEGAPAGERRRGRRGRDGGEPGLADAAGSEQGDEPIGCQGVGEAGQLGVAADERRPRAGQPRDPGRRGGRRAARSAPPSPPARGDRPHRACAAATTRGSRPCAPRCAAAARSRRWSGGRRVPDSTSASRADISAGSTVATDPSSRRTRGHSVVVPWWPRMCAAAAGRTLQSSTDQLLWRTR